MYSYRNNDKCSVVSVKNYNITLKIKTFLRFQSQIEKLNKDSLFIEVVPQLQYF